MDEAEALSALENSDPGTTEAQPVEDRGTTEVSDSFTNIDPQSLPPELKGLYNNMLTDYRAKTTEVAPWRKSFEGLDVDPDEARAMIDFYQSLNSDPEFAKDIYSQLGEALKPFLEDGTPNPTPTFDSNEDDSDPLAAKVSELEARLRQMDEMAKFNAGAAELQRQEMLLRSQHETWGDDDFEAVYHIATSFDGNLLEAGKQYEAMQNRIVANYLKSKAGVDASGGPVTTGANGAEPVAAPQDTTEAHKRAMEMLIQDLQGQ